MKNRSKNNYVFFISNNFNLLDYSKKKKIKKDLRKNLPSQQNLDQKEI